MLQQPSVLRPTGNLLRYECSAPEGAALYMSGASRALRAGALLRLLHRMVLIPQLQRGLLLVGHTVYILKVYADEVI